jgi:RNA polymerase sigma-70 factor (ECF subfamily)
MRGTLEATSLQRLAQRYSEGLLRYIQRFVADPDDAADVLQDVWLTVMLKGRSYSGSGPLLGWTVAITRNACLMYLRSPWQQRRQAWDEGGAFPESWSANGSTVGSPEADFFRKAFWADVTRALAHLAPRQQQVVTLRCIEGLSTRATACALGCGEGTVKRTLSRALYRLRTHLSHWRS